jgi:hypothetical protein
MGSSDIPDGGVNPLLVAGHPRGSDKAAGTVANARRRERENAGTREG